MKIFQTFQGLVCFIFVHPKWNRVSNTTNSDCNTSNPIEKYPYNFINLVPWLHLIFCLILCLNFLFNEAETFQEYSDCVYGVLVASMNIFIDINVLLNREKFFDFIGNIERIIEIRKLFKFFFFFENPAKFSYFYRFTRINIWTSLCWSKWIHWEMVKGSSFCFLSNDSSISYDTIFGLRIFRLF